MNFFNKTIALILTVASPLVGAHENAKDRMIQDLDVIRHHMKTTYAPADWKKEYCGWDLDDQITAAKVQVLNTPNITTKKFQHIVKNFYNSTKDYHVSVYFHSTEFSFLPMRLRSSCDREYFLTEMDLFIEPVNIDPEDEAPLQTGDQILTFNHRPIHEAVTEYKEKEFRNATPGTDQALAEMLFFARMGFMGTEVPCGENVMTVRHTNGTESTYILPWIHFPEEIADLPDVAASKFLAKNSYGFQKDEPIGNHPIFKKKMISPMYYMTQEANDKIRYYKKKMEEQEEQEQEKGHDHSDRHLGERDSFLPVLGNVIWKSDATNEFDAYLFENQEGKRIGYIRIPSYLVWDEQTAVSDFSQLVNQFEALSDMLVIDQLNNPGGSVFYLYALASTLSDQPLIVPKHRQTLDQEFIQFAIYSRNELETVSNDEEAKQIIGPHLGGYPVDYDLTRSLVEYFDFILDQWQRGNQCTDPAKLYGIDWIKPHHEGQYTKPILLLINSLDFSGGDFFPAILQDNERVTILGSRTAGAGGYVGIREFPNLNGIMFYTYTGSIAERVNLNPIENLGVTPDIEYEYTKDDILHHYPDFAAKIHETIDSMLR